MMTDAQTAHTRSVLLAEDYFRYLDALIAYLDDQTSQDKLQIFTDKAQQQRHSWPEPRTFDIVKLINQDVNEWTVLLRILEAEGELFQQALALSPYKGKLILRMHRMIDGRCTIEGGQLELLLSLLLGRDGLRRESGNFLVILPGVNLSDLDNVSIVHAD